MRIKVLFKDKRSRDKWVSKGRKLEGLENCIREGRMPDQIRIAGQWRDCGIECEKLNAKLSADERKTHVYRPLQKPGSNQVVPKKYLKEKLAKKRGGKGKQKEVLDAKENQ